MSIFSKAINEPDRVLAILATILAVVLTCWVVVVIGRPVVTIESIILVIVFASYLVIRRRSSPLTSSALSQLYSKSSLYLILNIIFFLLFTYSVISIYLRPELYIRPLGYFISVALMMATLAVEILFLTPKKTHTYFVLFKIILVALSLVWLQQLIFPSVLGSDPLAHQLFTLEILDAGHVPGGHPYSRLPVMHLMIGATSLVTGLGYKMATMLSVGLLNVLCDTLFIFLIGRFIHSTKVGLMAALLVAMANHHINLAVNTLPTNTGAILIPIIIYLLFKMRQEKPIVSTSLSILLMGVLILTHPLAAMWLAILLFIFWLGFEFYNRVYRERREVPVAATIAALFPVGMLSWWMYASGHIWNLAKLLQWGFSLDYVLGSPLSETVIEYGRAIPFPEELFNQIGMFLFFALAFIGCFYMLSRDFGNRFGLVLAIGGIIVLAIPFLASVTGRTVIEHRWWYLSQVITAIPLGITLFLLCQLFRSKLMKVLLLVALVLILSFLMIMSPEANRDNRVFAKNYTIRYAFTEAELQAMNTISNIWDGEIGTDTHYRDMRFRTEITNEMININRNFIDKDFSDPSGMLIMIREEVVHNTFKAYHMAFKLDYDPRRVLAEQGFSRIYENGSVSAFQK